MDDDLGGVLVWVAVLCGIVVWSSWDSDNIIGHLRHQIAYGVSYSKVDMKSRPKDCDFFGAPVGMKDCRYEPVVTAYNAAAAKVPVEKPTFGNDTKTGKLVVSYDDGKTWSWPTIVDHKIESIEVQWKKVTN